MALPADEMVFAFFGTGPTFAVHCFNCSFFSGVKRRTRVSSIGMKRRKNSVLLLSRPFSLRSSITALWIFFTTSGVVNLFGRPLRCSSWQLVRSRINSAVRYFIVVNEGADSPKE
ncbi:hypothetical protein TNCV_4045211 [Trichonephila clavipes]|nr:hypothetical protein TNCV_4045211 [Trichonephila clavipes]